MSTLIGRDQEFSALDDALKAAAAGSGSCLLITGEAGIGKSRLVEELKRKTTARGFRVLQGNCFEQDAALPYAPWIDAMRISFAPLGGQEIKRALGPLAPEFAKLLPELSLIIPGLQPSPSLEPSSEKYRLLESLSRFLLASRESRPAVIVLEDLHWSDSLSLELLHSLARRIPRLPVLLIGTLRLEEGSSQLSQLLSDLKREHLAREIALHPLDRDEVAQMAGALLQLGHRIPPAVGDALQSLTDGIPFFLEEILSAWRQIGRVDQLLQHPNLDALDVPPGIQRIVQHSIERLPAPARRTLLLASVIGERFDFGLLREAAERSEQDLVQDLKEILATHLILQESANQFAFVHSLTRDAVRSLVMLHEQKALHARIGQMLEGSYGTASDSHLEELAYHFYQAEAWQKAMQYSEAAGARAHTLYAPHEALVHFTRALDAAGHLGLSPTSASLRGRAQAHELSGDFDPARLDYESNLGLARRSTDPRAEWQALIDLGLLWQSRDFQRAGEYFQQALERARQMEDPASLAVSLNRMGNWYVNQGQPRHALSLHRQALDLFSTLNDRRGIAVTMDLLGILSYGLGEVLQGAGYLAQAVSIQRELDDRQGLVNSLANLTLQARQETEVLGDIDYRKLSDLSDEALQIAQGFNWYHGQSLALIQGAICLGKAGEYGAALDRIDRAQSIVEASGNRESFARLHFTYAGLLADLLALPEARQQFEAGLAVVTELGSGILARTAAAQLASVVILQRDLVRAHTLLDPLTSSNVPPGGLPASQRFCWAARAELDLADGNPGRALEIVDGLIASTANLAKYGPHAVPRLSRLRASALSAFELPHEAEEELRGALTVAERRGQRPLLWRLHSDLGAVYRTLRRRDAADREFTAAESVIQDLARTIPAGALHDSFLRQAMAVVPTARPPTALQAAKQEFSGLTTREREIAARIARGRSNREIATELVISEKTAERHVANILLKLGFNSRTQIAVWATERGLNK